ncbi:MAG: hypothetical protein K9L85_01410 [Candidatus Peribacteraceae bacterium]|nr:hypothetical protein [Candidatus Peribacteraceae bacterium]
MEKLKPTEKISNLLIDCLTLAQGSFDRVADLLDPKTPRQKIERVFSRLGKGFIRGRRVGPELERILRELNDAELEDLQGLLNTEVDNLSRSEGWCIYSIRTRGKRVKVSKY